MCRFYRTVFRLNVPIYSSQGLWSGVSKHTRLQYGISDPGGPEFVAYRKPVVMFRRTGGLALTGRSARMTTSIKKSLTERCGVGTLVDGTGG